MGLLRQKKILTLIFMFFFVSSCSRLDIAVELASTYLVKKANDYFDLNHNQSKWVRNHFNTDFDKVKKIIFPQLATELIHTADLVVNHRKFTENMVDTSFIRVKNLLSEALRMFTVSAVAFSDQLTPKQVSYFQIELNKKNADLLDESSQKKSYKKMKKNFDSFLGRITDEQKKALEKFIAANPDPVNEKIEHRKNLANEFAKAYPDKALRKLYIENLFNKYETLYGPKFSKILKDRNNVTAGFVASILNMMTVDQRKNLVEILRERANQLIKISKG